MVHDLPPSPLRGWSEPIPAETLTRAAQLRAPEGAVKALTKLKQEYQAEYSAGMPSRFRRSRSALGGLADAHMLVSIQFWNTREYARDMDRNDALFKQLVDRAVDMRIGVGPTPSPMTGDDALDRWLLARWRGWAQNPFACDAAKKKAFPEMIRAMERALIVDGDIFLIPVDEGPGAGALQMVEGDHVDSPQAIGGDLFHGVRLDPTTEAPVSYRFIRVSDHLNFAHLIYYAWTSDPSHYVDRPAFDEDGRPLVLHAFDPSRTSQRRGVTAFHAVFDYFGMVEDTMFSTLVKQQMASCVMGYLESPWDQTWGSRTNETQSDGTLQVLQELQPGVVLRGPQGTKLTPFTPNIPGSDFLNHLLFNVRLLGGALHLPLEIALMDYSLGNFSSQRMAIDQARQAVLFRRESIARLQLQHIYDWKARGWLEEKGINIEEHPEALDHKWRWGGFPYHDKRADAEADKIRVDNLQASPREIATENGYDWEEIVAEAVEDNAIALETAIKRAAKIKMPEGANPLDPRELLNRALPGGATQTTTSNPGQDEVQKEQVKVQKEQVQKQGEVAQVDRAEVTAVVRAEVQALGSVLAKALGEHALRSEERLERLLLASTRTQAAPPTTPMVHADHLTMEVESMSLTQPDGSKTELTMQLAKDHPVSFRADKIENKVEVAEGAIRIEKHETHVAAQVQNNFAPQIHAHSGETKVDLHGKFEVTAKLPPRESKRIEIEHPDGSKSVIQG